MDVGLWSELRQSQENIIRPPGKRFIWWWNLSRSYFLQKRFAYAQTLSEGNELEYNKEWEILTSPVISQSMYIWGKLKNTFILSKAGGTLLTWFHPWFWRKSTPISISCGQTATWVGKKKNLVSGKDWSLPLWLGNWPDNFNLNK